MVFELEDAEPVDDVLEPEPSMSPSECLTEEVGFVEVVGFRPPIRLVIGENRLEILINNLPSEDTTFRKLVQ